MQTRRKKSNDTAPQPIPQDVLSFDQVNLSNPCQTCKEAMCCKMLLLPYPTPANFMDMDSIKYMLGFPGTNMILHENGNWQIQIEQNCRFLTAENLCSIHDTPEIPKTCTFFNPYNCFYRQNFTADHSGNLIKINYYAFKKILERISFDELGNITAIPTQEEIRQIVLQNVNTEN